MEIIKCLQCGKEVVQAKGGRKRKFCGSNCAHKYNYKISFEEYCTKKPVMTVKKRPKPKKTLAEINAMARAEGLTYGEYMARHGY